MYARRLTFSTAFRQSRVSRGFTLPNYENEPNDEAADADHIGAFGFPDRLDRARVIDVEGTFGGQDRSDWYSVPVSGSVSGLWLYLQPTFTSPPMELSATVRSISLSYTVSVSGALSSEGWLDYRLVTGMANVTAVDRFDHIEIYDDHFWDWSSEEHAFFNEVLRPFAESFWTGDDQDGYPAFDEGAGLDGALAELDAIAGQIQSDFALGHLFQAWIDSARGGVHEYFSVRETVNGIAYDPMADALDPRFSIAITPSEGLGLVRVTGRSSVFGPDQILGTPFSYGFTLGAPTWDSIYDTSRNDRFSGGAEADVFDGGAGDDRLAGGGGADVLSGGVGRDILSGGTGSDRLDGGAGTDRVTGGVGRDSFVFARGSERETVTDYRLWQDRLVLDRALFDDPAAFRNELAAITQTGRNGLRIDFGEGDVLFLTGLSSLQGVRLWLEDLG